MLQLWQVTNFVVSVYRCIFMNCLRVPVHWNTSCIPVTHLPQLPVPSPYWQTRQTTPPTVLPPTSLSFLCAFKHFKLYCIAGHSCIFISHIFPYIFMSHIRSTYSWFIYSLWYSHSQRSGPGSTLNIQNFGQVFTLSSLRNSYQNLKSLSSLKEVKNKKMEANFWNFMWYMNFFLLFNL